MRRSRTNGHHRDEEGHQRRAEAELDQAFERARKALAIIETYDQARVDRLCQAIAWAVANKKTFTGLVDMGIKESGLGDAESRMNKRMKIRGVLRDALRQKSVGIIEELPEKGIVKYGKPVGVIACIVPTTNPDLTPAGNAIYAIKARDAVIFSPHPRAKKTSFETVRLMREALEREGAPADLLQCLTKVNIPMSQALMSRADLVDRHRRPADGARRLQLGNAGLRRGRRQRHHDHRRDRQHRGSRPQHAPLQDLRLRFGLLGRRQPGHPGRRLRRDAGAAGQRKAAMLPANPRRPCCARRCGTTKVTGWATPWRSRRRSSPTRPASRSPPTASSSS